jgi:epoxyqueuosine reductase
LRNIAVALGNVKSLEAVPALIGALDDQEMLVRGHAAWALGQIGSTEAIEALEKRSRVEKDPAVKQEIEAALVEGQSLRTTAREPQPLRT